MTKEEVEELLGHQPFTKEQLNALGELQNALDWKTLRNQAAISLLSAMAVREGPDYQTACRNMKSQVQEAVEYANMLVEELKK